MLKKNNKLIYILLVLLLALSPFVFVPGFSLRSAADFVRFELSDKSGLNITLKTIDPHITALSADPENDLVMKLVISDKEGLPVPEAGFSIIALDGNAVIQPAKGRTGADGSILITYRPSALPAEAYTNGKTGETLTASISGSTVKTAFSFDLVHIPVVLIPGYKAPVSIFGSFASFLKTKGYTSFSLDYSSENGVAYGAVQLGDLLDKKKQDFLDKGVQVKRFDLIGHSMGGLVARYYTGSREYSGRNDVEKIIFVSVPQNGSALASLGLKYYSDKGIYDLIPDSPLFTKDFPGMYNKGLNNNIQVGSILGQYDEVVSAESASLDEWGIRTELFNVGENNFTMDNLLSGKIVEAANHKAVLFNNKVFRRVEEMLGTKLSFPIKK